MKNLKNFLLVFLTALSTLFIYSCTQENTKSGTPVPKIENTLKSVSLFQDSTNADPGKLQASIEKLNQAIDSIGYPDAGYKIWQVDSQDSLDFKFMVEGYWPDQKTYDIIHEHELYKKIRETVKTNFEALQSTCYHKFKKVK